MLLNRKTFVLEGASSDSSPALECVRIEEDGSGIACDGKMLVKFTPLNEPDPKEYPKFEGINVNGKSKLKPFSLPASAARAVLRGVPRGRKFSLPILHSIVLDVEQTNSTSHALLAYTDLKRPTVMRPEKLDLDFPKYEAIIPKGKPKMTIGFSVDVLLKTLKMLKVLDVEFFTVKIFDEHLPVVINATTDAKDGKVFCVVMPANVGSESAAPTPEPPAKAEDNSYVMQKDDPAQQKVVVVKKKRPKSKKKQAA